ncbi:MAG: hypothetical protein LBL24_02740 [Bacteroidales bacterium]|nr:hypothetical protein [Bacteroidales bacterium]
MRQIEKHEKKYGGDSWKSREVKKAEAKQKKQEEEAQKEAEKIHKDGITRHRAFQTQETRDRMDQHLKESDERHSTKKVFFLVRWFRPVDNIEKIEKRRAKEVKKRMAATLKKAEKNNAEHRITNVKTKERTFSKPDPKNEQHGGGGAYREGSATKYNSPSDMQQGGGGSYAEGKSKSRVKASDSQQGGGSSYQEGKSGKRQKASSSVGETKGTSPRKNPFSRKTKPKAGE